MNFRNRWFFLSLLLFVICIPFSLTAQESPSVVEGEKPNLFLDCNRCFENYLKENVNLVNYVRDKNDAQIHLLITRARTGSSGTEYTLAFLGRDGFKSMQDTLTYSASDTNTEDETREGLANRIKIGLVPFISKTSLIDLVNVNFETEGQQDAPQNDVWNRWVFEISGFGFISGESQRNSLSVDGEVSANRTTKKWKIELEASANYQRDRFELDDEEEEEDVFTSTETRQEFEALVVKSLSPHWSAGFSSEASTSSFRNIDLQLEISPAVEFNVYPYSEYNKREFTFLYELSPTYFQFQDTTIFNKTEEFIIQQSMEISYELVQPWGSAETSLEGSTFLRDFSKNRLDFRTELEFRLFRGLDLNIFGRYSLINDQIAISGEGITDEEVLLRRRQQATGFEFNVGVGLSYTFGSIYNNIVNPRF